MKITVKKKMTFEEQKQINKVVLWLTLILLICATAMSIFGVLADINRGAAYFLGINFISSFSFDKSVKRSLRTVSLAVSIISDAMYVVFLFFLLGRVFMQNIL